MTKEEWEKLQSVVRRVYDPDTGRHRCIHNYTTGTLTDTYIQGFSQILQSHA